MNESSSALETPLPSADLLMALPSSAALLLIPSPSSDAMSNLTAPSMDDESTRQLPFSSAGHCSTMRPILRILVTRMQLLGWSECIGHATMGTPMLRLSTHEFHPQWLKKPPTHRCPRITSCGTHSLTTSPIPPTLCSNPFGSGNSAAFVFRR